MSFERTLTYKGETLSVAEWARRTGLKDKTIYMRFKAGWSVEDIIEKPIQNKVFSKNDDKRMSDKERERRQEALEVREYQRTFPANWSSDRCEAIEERRDEGEIL